MDTTQIIQEIDAEIARLEQAKNLLNGGTHSRAKRGRKPSKPTSFDHGANATTVKPRRKISAEGRARIAAAQKARWAKTK